MCELVKSQYAQFHNAFEATGVAQGKVEELLRMLRTLVVEVEDPQVSALSRAAAVPRGPTCARSQSGLLVTLHESTAEYNRITSQIRAMEGTAKALDSLVKVRVGGMPLVAPSVPAGDVASFGAQMDDLFNAFERELEEGKLVEAAQLEAQMRQHLADVGRVRGGGAGKGGGGDARPGLESEPRLPLLRPGTRPRASRLAQSTPARLAASWRAARCSAWCGGSSG